MGAILRDKARSSELPSRSASEPNRASLSKLRAANLSEMAKPALSPQQCSGAGEGLSGVKEGGAVGQSIQEHERPWQTGWGQKGKPALAEKK